MLLCALTGSAMLSIWGKAGVVLSSGLRIRVFLFLFVRMWLDQDESFEVKVCLEKQMELTCLFAKGCDVCSSCSSFCEQQGSAQPRQKDSEKWMWTSETLPKGNGPFITLIFPSMGCWRLKMNLQWDVRIILTLHMNHGLFFEKHTAIKNKYSFLHWLYLHSFGDINSDMNPAWYWTCGDDEFCFSKHHRNSCLELWLLLVLKLRWS